mgnify:CR=1 FL=1
MGTKNRKDFKIMCQVLERLNELSIKKWHQQKDLRGSTIGPRTIYNFERLTTRYYPIHETAFKKLVSETSEDLCLYFEKGYYLPPLDYDREFIPLLALDCNLKHEPPILMFRVGLYRYDPRKIDKFQGIGFRFEKYEESNHNYYHMQLTKKPIKIQEYEYLEWMPEHIPCVLLPAKDPVSLIFSMLISLYGNRIAEQMITPMNIDGKYKEPLKFLHF